MCVSLYSNTLHFSQHPSLFLLTRRVQRSELMARYAAHSTRPSKCHLCFNNISTYIYGLCVPLDWLCALSWSLIEHTLQPHVHSIYQVCCTQPLMALYWYSTDNYTDNYTLSIVILIAIFYNWSGTTIACLVWSHALSWSLIEHSVQPHVTYQVMQWHLHQWHLTDNYSNCTSIVYRQYVEQEMSSVIPNCMPYMEADWSSVTCVCAN